MSSYNISKVLFFDNTNEYLWSGSGRTDFDLTGEAEAYEPHNETFERWFKEYQAIYNEKNPHNQMTVYWDDEDECWVFRTVKRFNKKHEITFPNFDNTTMKDELFEIPKDNCSYRTPITSYSIADEDN
jgi:hypothetical protein